MKSPEIAIVVAAGEWPQEAALQALARRAVNAVVAAIGEAPSNPSPNPSAQGEGQQELSIVFTDDAAIRRLNAQYRGKDAPTNVLSFPQTESPAAADSGMLLGDVILAAETLRREAALASKPLEDHMVHLIIHGFLHLLGYDHQTEAAAEKMEQLERVALNRLGIPDPYATA
jgi:probable rRNA maturation factor